MNRYWDLSERERSELTEEQLESMLTVELMEKGVVKIEMPSLLPVEFEKVPTKRVFAIKRGWAISDVAYATAEQAQSAIEHGIWVGGEYIGNERVNVIDRQPLSIECIEVCEPNDVAARKSMNDKAAANKKQNDAALKAYNESCEAVTAATSGVWEDYRECQAKARRYRKIIETFSEYTAICDGDEAKADIFLSKAYKPDEVAAAKEWYAGEVAAETA